MGEIVFFFFLMGYMCFYFELVDVENEKTAKSFEYF